MNILVLIPIIASFIITLSIMPFWIRKANQIGLVWKDMNKVNGNRVAGSGGIVVLMAFIVAVLLYVAFLTFYVEDTGNLVDILAVLLSVVFVGGIGLIDDLLGWQRGGLSRRSRIILVLMAAIPLMAIKAGESLVNLPLLGAVDLGIIYPLILIPLGIIGATTTFNFLAGFNGLEAGQGIVLLTGGVIVSYFMGNAWISVLLVCMIVSLLAFMKFNFYPAKVFPGDVLTYPVGALFVATSIVGNFEKVALFFFIPFIIEVALKCRGKLTKYSFGKPKKDGTIEMKYQKVYGLTHLAIWIMNLTGIKATEKKVVYLIWAFQTLIVLIGFFIFREGIFYHA